MVLLRLLHLVLLAAPLLPLAMLMPLLLVLHAAVMMTAQLSWLTGLHGTSNRAQGQHFATGSFQQLQLQP